VKFLKAVRLDASDSQVYSREGAARDGEWLVSGGYAVCDPTGVTHRTPNCHCLTSFIGIVSRGRCTIAEVEEIDKSEYQQVIERLVRHLVDDLGAPTLEAASAVAEEETAYTAELCESFGSGMWITVKRTPGDDRIKEHYSVFKRLMIGGHKL
jgi:Family of unknown function (DUF6505)